MNLLLKLLSYPLVIANNNLPIKIICYRRSISLPKNIKPNKCQLSSIESREILLLSFMSSLHEYKVRNSAKKRI